jgi:hypothetical protein
VSERRRSALWFLAALAAPALLLIAIARLAVNVPYWDDWRWANMVVRFDTHRLTFADLWHPEVEHRILVPSLAALGLSRFGGYSTVVESYFSWVCSLVSLACLYVLLRRTFRPEFVGPILLVQSVLLFSLAQLTTYLWGFQIAWTMVNALVLLVLVLLSARQPAPLQFVLAMVGATAAALSSAQGLLVLPLGFVALVVRRPRPNRYLVIWSLVSIVVVVAYLPGLSPHFHAEGITLQGQLLRVLVWPVVLGAPIAGWSGVLGSLVAGLIALWLTTAFTLVYIRLVRRRSPQTGRWTMWLMLAVFGVLGSLMIAFGRGALGLSYGLQERYITLASFAWIGLIPLAVLQIEKTMVPMPKRMLAWILLTTGILVFSLAGEYVSSIPATLAAHERRLGQYDLVLNYRRSANAYLVALLFPNESARAFMRVTDFPSPDDVPGIIAGLEASGEGPFRPH